MDIPFPLFYLLSTSEAFRFCLQIVLDSFSHCLYLISLLLQLRTSSPSYAFFFRDKLGFISRKGIKYLKISLTSNDNTKRNKAGGQHKAELSLRVL